MSLTKPRVICSTFFRDRLLEQIGRIFLTTNTSRRAAKLISLCRQLLTVKYTRTLFKLPSLNYVPSNQIALRAGSVQQPFNQSWQTSQKKSSRTSLVPLITRGLIFLAPSRLPFFGLSWGGGFFFNCLITRVVLVEVVHLWTAVPV